MVRPAGIKYTYPNAYLFCMSVFEDDAPIPEPATIDKDYDSYYEIRERDIKNFEALLRSQLTQALTYQDIEFSKLKSPAPISTPIQLAQVVSKARPVEYVKSRDLLLETPEDFELQALSIRYIDIVFEKSDDHRADGEYRIAFFLQHPNFGLLSAFKRPKILELNPVANFLR